MKSLLLAAAFAATAALSATAGEGLMAVEPFAFETSRSAKAAGAYISVMSHGEADRLIGAASPAAKRVEIHTHIQDGDVMRMRQVGSPLPVSADTPIKMGPGGVHVMLMGLNAPLEAGTSIPVTLIFETAGEMLVEVPVKKRSDHTGHGGHRHHSGDNNASD